VPYLQNSGEYATMEQTLEAYEPKIQPNDLLSIVIVNPDNPSSSISYNLIAPSDIQRNGTASALQAQPALQNYLVDKDGCVVIPNVGKLTIAGLTIKQAEELVFDKVKGGFSSTPVVTVRFADFKVSVLGEVTRPGEYSIKNGRVNILQALALAGDLTIYGQRENVKVVREDMNGRKEIAELDLNDVAVLNSPYYNLQQNDIVYVTPNKSKAGNADIGSSTSLWFSGTSILISLASLLYNILK
jgi:polysaccharide export outer membrane protein